MGLARSRKPSPDAPQPEDVLADARAYLAEIEGQHAAFDMARDAALLADDKSGVERAEANLATTAADVERARRRIELLETKAAEEQRRRQEQARAEEIARGSRSFDERDEATAEMLRHMNAMLLAFQRAIALNNKALAGWRFGPGQIVAAMLGRGYLEAIAHELYRLTGGAGGLMQDRNAQCEFPGARCPTPLGDRRPEMIQPLLERVREGSEYAKRIMREAPLSTLPIAPAEAGTPNTPPNAKNAPAAAAESPRAPGEAISPAEAMLLAAAEATARARQFGGAAE